MLETMGARRALERRDHGTRRGLLRRGIVATGAVAALAACAAPAGGGPGGTASKQPVTLRWGIYNEQPFMDTATATTPAFTAKYPNITLEQEPKPGSGLNYEPELISGSGPDVFVACCYALPVWGKQGLLANLDPLLKRDGKEVPLTDYVAALIKFWNTPEQGQFALPMSSYSRVLYYNKTRFKRKGVAFPDATWDWNTFREVMLQLNEAEDSRGWYYAVGYETTGHYIRQNGGMEVDQKTGRAAWDQPPALAALQWLHERMWKDRSLARQPDLKPYLDAAKGSTSATLVQGNIALLTEGAWHVPRLATQMPEQSDQWDITILPRGPVKRDTHASTDGWAIFAGSKYKDEAWNLMKFLQSDTWLEPAVGVAGHLPARKSWADKYTRLMKERYPVLADKNLAAITDGIKQDYAHPTEVMARHVEAQKVFDDTLQEALIGNQRAIADAFRDAAQRANAINGV